MRKRARKHEGGVALNLFPLFHHSLMSFPTSIWIFFPVNHEKDQFWLLFSCAITTIMNWTLKIDSAASCYNRKIAVALIFRRIIHSILHSQLPWNFRVLLCRRCCRFEMRWDTVRSVFSVCFFWEDCQRHPGVCKRFCTSWALITSRVTRVSSWASSGSVSVVSSSIEGSCIALEWGGDLLSFR